MDTIIANTPVFTTELIEAIPLNNNGKTFFDCWEISRHSNERYFISNTKGGESFSYKIGHIFINNFRPDKVFCIEDNTLYVYKINYKTELQ